MSRLYEFDAIVSEYRKNYTSVRRDMQRGLERIQRLKQFAENTPAYLQALNDEFEEKTSLNDREISIMFVAVGLQILRQHYLTKFPERVDDQTGGKTDPFHGGEYRPRQHQYYNPTLEEIINNPVPFDANIGANGALSGGGHMGHRVTAIGHDPLLGLIFGTANIATSTLTTKDFDSYHIKTFNSRDAFAEKASTALVLQKTAGKLFKGKEGLKKVGISFVREIAHLRSDVHTKNSLPLPVISVIDAKFAAELASYGLDFANVLTVSGQVTMARLINSLIAMYHFCFYDGNISKNLYEVKTKKIICYSNVIASGVNLAEVGLTRNFKLLDIGGIANTIFELVTSVKFIKKVKRDFIFGTYDAALEAL